MRNFLFLVLIFVLAGLITRNISEKLNDRALSGTMHSSAKNFADWVNETIPNLNNHPGKKIIALGASQTFFGITPRALDAELKNLGIKSLSYNMSYPALDPLTVELMVRHMASIWGGQDKIDLLILGFAPHFHTKRYSETDINDVHNQIVSAHLNSNLNNIILLPGNPMDEVLKTLSMQFLNVEPDRPRKILMEIIEGNNPNKCRREFLKSRGGETCYFFSDFKFKRHMNVKSISISHFNKRVEQADIQELRLDYDALGHVIRSAENAKKIAKEVVVVLTPRNTEIVDTSLEGLERLKTGLLYVSNEANIDVLDFYSEDYGYEAHNFIDATHLNEAGSLIFSKKLAIQLFQKYFSDDES